MQTVEPQLELPGGAPPPRRGGVLAAIALVVAVPLIVLTVNSKIGVIVALVLALLVGIAIWVQREGIAFIQVVAFLIHFDGLGRGPITAGRAIAATAALLIVYKLVVEKWRPPAVPMRHWFPPIALFLWAAISGVWSATAGSWFFAMGLLGLGLAYFCVTAFLIDSHDNIEKFLRAYWYGGLFGMIGGVVGLVMRIRSYGMSSDANFFGLLNASMIPLTIYYRRHATTRNGKLLYSIVVLGVLGAAAGTGSRSGLIGSSLVIVATMITRPGLSRGQRARTGLGAVVLAVVAFGVLFVANPANLERGFNDRGAGRIDFWNVTIQLIKEQPILGYGAGGLGDLIPPNLAITPGVQRLDDVRADTPAHNTWLDVTGDLGVVGLVIFVSIFVITIYGFIRPRWTQYKELSTLLLVMMVPVLSGSNLLPLLNNKLAWALIGLSAALQVPSWGARYKGYFAARPESDPTPDWTASTLARWDLRISRRFRAYILAGGVIGAVLFAIPTSGQPAVYVGSVQIFVDVPDEPASFAYPVDPYRAQIFHTLILSDAYAGALKELAGLDLGIREIRDRVGVDRQRFRPHFHITFTETDSALVEQASPFLLPALEEVIDEGRARNSDIVADELRPSVPGEAREWTGDLYSPVSEQPTYETETQRVGWSAFIGFVSGAMAAAIFVISRQRKPRVNNDDSFPDVVGMPLWSHVGRSGRRFAASPAQYAYVSVVATDEANLDEPPRRSVIATPESSGAARALALGVAAALAAQGERVVLVDGQVDRPWLSLRQSGLRRGITEVQKGDVELKSVIRRVNRWRLPTSVRRTLGHSSDNLRFIPAGRAGLRGDARLDPSVLDSLDPGVHVVLLAPPVLGRVPTGPALGWGDVVLYCLVEGATVTFDAEDAALRIRTLTSVPAGVVLADV